MSNSSLESNYSVCLFSETLDWDYKGHYGKRLGFITSMLCFIVGTPVHCWFLWVYFHGNIKPNLVFHLNIIILELLFCIQCIAYCFLIMYPSQLGYKCYLFLVGLAWTCRPIIQICISIEQYVAVIYPVTFLRYKSIHYRIGSAGVAWLISLGNSVKFIFLSSVSPQTFPDHIFLLLFCAAVIIVSFCCISLLCALKHPGPGERTNVKMTEKDTSNKTYRVKTRENHQKRKAFQKISHVLVSMLTCYIFLVVAYFIVMAKIHTYICDIIPLVLSFTVMAVLISSVVRVCVARQVKDMFFKLREQIKRK